MDTKQLGTTDLHITPIGFGAWDWVTSRQPDDLPAYDRAMIALFARRLVPSHL